MSEVLTTAPQKPAYVAKPACAEEVSQLLKTAKVERVVEDISFQSPDSSEKHIRIDGNYVRGRLAEVLQKEDVSKFIL